MNYIKMTSNDIANGEGVRVVLWLSGCEHQCVGCHNPHTHNVDAGVVFDKIAKQKIYDELKKTYVSGITFSGGDPLHSLNVFDVFELINEIKQNFQNKTIWLYTGYTLEFIYKQNDDINRCRQDIVELCDILVDGKYIKDKHDLTLKWRGSSNQRVIDIQESKNQRRIVLYTN